MAGKTLDTEDLDDNADRITKVFKALGDPSRLRIVCLIAEAGEMTIKELAEGLGLAQPTITHHVNRLEAAGLASRRKDRVWSVVTPNLDAFAEISALLKPVRR